MQMKDWNRESKEVSVKKEVIPPIFLQAGQ